MDGLKFLTAVKADDALKQIIVIIPSGSDDEEDIAESFRLGAAGYIVKLPDYNKLVEMIRTIHAYWTLSKLPHGGASTQSDCPGSLQ